MNTVLTQRNSWICSLYSYSYCMYMYFTYVTAVMVQCSEQNNRGKGCDLHRNDGVQVVLSDTAHTWLLSRTRTQPFAPIRSASWAHSWVGRYSFRPVSASAIWGSFEGSFSLCRWWAAHCLQPAHRRALVIMYYALIMQRSADPQLFRWLTTCFGLLLEPKPSSVLL